MQSIHLRVDNTVIDGKTCRITHLEEDGCKKTIEIFYEFDRIIPWSGNVLLDGHIFAVLLYAMSRGKGLKIHGNVSRTALRNIEELQSIWALWKPDLYKKIAIIPDRIDDTKKYSAKEKAIAAFSGGVDSTFTALRHTKILPQATRYPLTSALMVHGFDVDVYNFDDFNHLATRVKPLLDDLGLELFTVRTNSRELKFQEWDYSHGLELAACLNMLYEDFDYGLIASSHSYQSLKFPWGSTPATDYLISGSHFSTVYDGSGFTRTEKVANIKNFPTACRTLKVCWAGSDQSGNCGKCEKCVRTQLNFLAAGMVSTPPCFPQEFDINSINTMKIYSASKIKGFKEIVKYAKLHHVSGQWLTSLENKIKDFDPQNKAMLASPKTENRLKKILVKFITLIGLDEPAKKVWRKIYRKMLKLGI